MTDEAHTGTGERPGDGEESSSGDGGPARPPGYLRPYRHAAEHFGTEFAATLWHSPESQTLRFEVMASLVDLEHERVIDVGCGRADFAAYLIEHEIDYEKYIGVDAIDSMVEYARQRNLPRCEFVVADVISHPEVLRELEPGYICLSGTLNTMEEAMARKLIEQCYSAARLGVVFNFLSDRPHARWIGRDLGPARRFDTVAWIDWALSMSSRVTFTQDYFDGHDATICIHHDELLRGGDDRL